MSLSGDSLDSLCRRIAQRAHEYRTGDCPLELSLEEFSTICLMRRPLSSTTTTTTTTTTTGTCHRPNPPHNFGFVKGIVSHSPTVVIRGASGRPSVHVDLLPFPSCLTLQLESLSLRGVYNARCLAALTLVDCDVNLTADAPTLRGIRSLTFSGTPFHARLVTLCGGTLRRIVATQQHTSPVTPLWSFPSAEAVPIGDDKSYNDLKDPKKDSSHVVVNHGSTTMTAIATIGGSGTTAAFGEALTDIVFCASDVPLFSALDSSWCRMRGAVSIALEGLRFESINAVAALRELPLLQRLSLRGNLLNEAVGIADWVPNLSVLDLSVNRLATLGGIEELHQLRELDVRDNGLSGWLDLRNFAAVAPLSLRRISLECNPLYYAKLSNLETRRIISALFNFRPSLRVDDVSCGTLYLRCGSSPLRTHAFLFDEDIRNRDASLSPTIITSTTATSTSTRRRSRRRSGQKRRPRSVEPVNVLLNESLPMCSTVNSVTHFFSINNDSSHGNDTSTNSSSSHIKNLACVETYKGDHHPIRRTHSTTSTPTAFPSSMAKRAPTVSSITAPSTKPSLPASPVTTPASKASNTPCPATEGGTPVSRSGANNLHCSSNIFPAATAAAAAVSGVASRTTTRAPSPLLGQFLDELLQHRWGSAVALLLSDISAENAHVWGALRPHSTALEALLHNRADDVAAVRSPLRHVWRALVRVSQSQCGNVRTICVNVIPRCDGRVFFDTDGAPHSASFAVRLSRSRGVAVAASRVDAFPGVDIHRPSEAELLLGLVAAPDHLPALLHVLRRRLALCSTRLVRAGGLPLWPALAHPFAAVTEADRCVPSQPSAQCVASRLRASVWLDADAALCAALRQRVGVRGEMYAAGRANWAQRGPFGEWREAAVCVCAASDGLFVARDRTASADAALEPLVRVAPSRVGRVAVTCTLQSLCAGGLLLHVRDAAALLRLTAGVLRTARRDVTSVEVMTCAFRVPRAAPLLFGVGVFLRLASLLPPGQAAQRRGRTKTGGQTAERAFPLRELPGEAMHAVTLVLTADGAALYTEDFTETIAVAGETDGNDREGLPAPKVECVASVALDKVRGIQLAGSGAHPLLFALLCADDIRWVFAAQHPNTVAFVFAELYRHLGDTLTATEVDVF